MSLGKGAYESGWWFQGEKRGSSRARRYPWQLWEQQPPTRHLTLSKSVEILTNPKLARNKLHNLTQLERTIGTIRETP